MSDSEPLPTFRLPVMVLGAPPGALLARVSYPFCG